MAIYIRKETSETICECDRCGLLESTDSPNGVVVEGWGTGQLWIDLSLSEERQVPICFCPTCTPYIKSSDNFKIQEEAPINIQVDSETLLQYKRESASMSRSDFILASISVGILQASDAGPAARGEIPPSLQPIFDSLPIETQTEAVVRWGAATIIERLNPILIILATAMSVSEEQLDSIFGII